MSDVSYGVLRKAHLDAEAFQTSLSDTAEAWDLPVSSAIPHRHVAINSPNRQIVHELDDGGAVKLELEDTVRLVLVRADLSVSHATTLTHLGEHAVRRDASRDSETGCGLDFGTQLLHGLDRRHLMLLDVIRDATESASPGKSSLLQIPLIQPGHHKVLVVLAVSSRSSGQAYLRQHLADLPRIFSIQVEVEWRAAR